MPKATLAFKDFMHPGCSCDLEAMALKVKGVKSADYDPVGQLLYIEYSETSEKKIVDALKACSCQAAPTPQKMEHMHEKGMPDHHAMMEKELKRWFLISLAVTVPLLVLSPTIQGWLGFSFAFSGDKYVLFALASIVSLYGGSFFYKGALRALKSGMLDMSVLVSIAVLAGYLYSVGTTFLFTAPDFYWEISTLVVFLLFGHWMEMRAVRGASGALQELVKLVPPKANLVKGKEIVEVETSSLKKGDVVLVRPGEKIPIDGIIVDGGSSVDESLITGESKPVGKKKGDSCIGGSLNIEGALRIRVTKTGEATALSQIIQLVKQAQASKPNVQKLADRAAHWLTVIAIVVSSVAFVYWAFISVHTLVFALTIAVTVLVIACPHALGLAIPTVTTISTTLAAKNGMLVRKGQALETAEKIDAVIFDKTGTLTKGEFGVTDVVPLGGMKKKELLSYAGSVEVNSEHVIARGIVKKAKVEKAVLKKTTKFKADPGRGVSAFVGKRRVVVGNAAQMKKMGFEYDESGFNELASQGKTVVFVATDKVVGMIALADLIRDESREAVRELKEMGLEVYMLTGDNKKTAAHVAKELGLTSYFAEVLPEDKDKAVRELQLKGKVVAMVGDGINDAPALVRADVGIAIGTGTDVAVESADMVLMRNDPRDVARLMRLSRLTMDKTRQNLVWATGYNVIAIPIAAGILQPWGVSLRPEWGALIMAASSIIVVTNALLMRGKKI
jgi:Cu2+-exporting ATPase